jgi:hypothetical protein
MYAIDNPAMKIAAMHHSHESFEDLNLWRFRSIKSEVYQKNYKKTLLILNRINLCST